MSPQSNSNWLFYHLLFVNLCIFSLCIYSFWKFCQKICIRLNLQFQCSNEYILWICFHCVFTVSAPNLRCFALPLFSFHSHHLNIKIFVRKIGIKDPFQWFSSGSYFFNHIYLWRKWSFTENKLFTSFLFLLSVCVHLFG